MSVIYFKDQRRIIGRELLEDEYYFGDFRVTNEEDKEGNSIYRKISFIHKVELDDVEIANCFLNIAENKYTEKECNGRCCKNDCDGSIIPERAFFPQKFQDFCDKEEAFLEQTIIRFFDNALWIYKSSVLFLHDTDYYWIYFSVDQKQWHLVPILPMKGLLGRPYSHEEYQRLEDEVKNKNKYLAGCLVKSMNDRQTAPIYPRIYFEAVNNLGNNPQTALVLAVESVEVAVKTCITYYDDKAKWLIENVPSPPLEKMLKEYITTFVPDGAPLIPKDLIKHSLHDAIAARNKIVHHGVYKVDMGKTQKWITDLGIIIAYLDYYIGAEWANYYFERPFNHWFFK